MPVSSPTDSDKRRIEFLKRVEPFEGLSEESLLVLMKDFHARAFADDEIIFHEADVSRDLYVIYEGKVRIYKLSADGEETSITLYRDHDLIGEMAAIDGKTRSASASAVGKCTLLAMSSDRLLRHMNEMPGLAIGMARLLCDRLRWTAEYAHSIAQYAAAARLLHMLLLYKERMGREIEPGNSYEIDLSANQADLASLAAVSRELVNRSLQEWQARNLIEYKAGKITILDLAGVESEWQQLSGAMAGSGGW